jgi:hypothetical protein
MKDALVRAAKASGRSLAQEIEDRLGRTLWEDHAKDDAAVRLDIFTRQVKELARALLLIEERMTPAIGDAAPTNPEPKSRKS